MSDDLEYQRVLARMIFQSPDEAATHALNKITEPRYEMGGVIYRNPQGFYSASDAQGDERTGKFSAEVRIPKKAAPVAIYHTHPGHGEEGDLAERFSSDDVKVANQMKMLSYIKALQSGNIRKFEPGKTPVETQGVGLRKTQDAIGSLISANMEK